MQIHLPVITITKKTFGGILAVVLLFAGMFVVSGSTLQAASNRYHPNVCLGGWENVQHASGAPDAEGVFSLAHAAYLAPDTSSQIFCGYFPVESSEQSPVSARVSFVWSLEVLQEEVIEEDTSSGGGGEEEVPPEESEPASAEEITPEPVSTEEVVPAPEPAPEEVSPVSFMQDIFAPRAHAQESDVLSGDFLEITYSFDGVNWYAAGRANVQNWRTLSVSIPANSWDELKNLQVKVSALPILGERPPVYLDAMELKVESNETLGELTGDALAAVGAALEGLVEEPPLPEIVLPELPVLEVPKPVEVQAPPPAKQQKLSFKVDGAAVQVGPRLPVPKVAIGNGGLSLTVQGTCTKPYFVVLTYKSVDDFIKKPRSFVSNYAGSCSGGSFSYDMGHLPVDTRAGTYYLVLGEQGEEGSWEPISSLLPIDISPIEVAPVE